MVFTEIIAKKLTAHEAKWLPEKSCFNTSVSIRVFSTRSAPDVSESPFFAPPPQNHPPPSQNRTKAKKPAAKQPKKPIERKATKSPKKAAKKPAKKAAK